MTGLDQGEKEVLDRMNHKEKEFQISSKFAAYIDMLETYLIELEDRVVALETMLGLRGLEPPQF